MCSIYIKCSFFLFVFCKKAIVSKTKITMDTRLVKRSMRGDVHPSHSNRSCGPKKINGMSDIIFAFNIAFNKTIHSSNRTMTPHLWLEVSTSKGVPSFWSNNFTVIKAVI